jgi:hypothetical protein
MITHLAITTGTGLTINIVNPGAGAYTPGMAEGRIAPLLEPVHMLPPLLWLISPGANRLNWLPLRRKTLGFGVAARRGRPARTRARGRS